MEKGEASTTMVFSRLLAKLIRDKSVGKRIVPIVPDEARTFGMDALFSQVGIYSAVGQLYEPIDKGKLLYYKETKDGQVLEEGHHETGSMASFIAAATSYAVHGQPMIPFTSFIRCSASSARAITCGRPPTRCRAASCSAPPRAAPR